MNKEFEEKGETFDGHRDTLKNLTDSYVGLSEIWDQSYTKLYKPWMNFMGESTDNLSGISMMAMPAVKFQKEIFENLIGIPDFYSESFERTAKLWKELYDKIYEPWFEPMEKFSESITKPSKKLLDVFQESIDINLNLYKGWVSAMEKMSEKFKCLSKFNGACRESTKIETIMKFDSVNRYAVPY